MTGTPRPETVYTKRRRIAELARNARTWPSRTWRITSTSTGCTGLCSDPQRRSRRRGRTDRGRLRDQPEGQPSGPPQPRQVRHVRGPARATSAYPQGRLANETRPLGIPTFEDKILQRAVLMVLEPVYETDFLDVSHGFRPGRGAHGALGVAVEAGDEAGRRLDRGRRSAKILRHDRPWPSAGVPQASGARWCDPATDRQMAQRGVLEDGVLYDSRDRYASRRSDQSSPGQHLPALRAGRMVRAGGSPPPERRGVPDSLCGRLRDRGGPRRRRAADHGGLAQADEQVRLDGPPGEDTTDPVPPARSRRLRD